jgi:O-acetylserine/cysteine efflux transporter
MKPLHILLAISVMAAWGFNFVVIRLGLDDLPPLFLSTLRFALAGLPILLIWRTPPAPIKWIFAVALSLGVFKFSLLFIGMSWGVGAGLSSLVLQMQAFFTIIVAFFILDERPSSRQYAGMLLAFTGLGLIIWDQDQSNSTFMGLCFVILAAAFWAFANIAMKEAKSRNPLHLIIWVSAFSAPIMFVSSVMIEGVDEITYGLTHIQATGIFSVLYLAFVATLAGFGIWAFLLRHYNASVVAPFSLLVPIFGMASGAIVLGENISTATIIAGLFILSGLALNSLQFKFMQRKVPSC